MSYGKIGNAAVQIFRERAGFTEAGCPRQLAKKACQKETLYQGIGIQVLCKGNVNKAILGLRGLWANEVHRNSFVLRMWMCCVWGDVECRTIGRNLGTAATHTGKFLWKGL